MTTTRRGRTRNAAATSKSKSRASGRTMGSRGGAGYKIAKNEAEKAAARREANSGNRGPLRFWLKSDGSESEVIILDNSLDDVFFMREHEIWDGKARNYVPCIQDFGSCPVCDAAEDGGKDSQFKYSYYAMYLSVLDTTPYEIQSGDRQGTVVEQTRKLLCVKQSQIDEFYRLLQASEKMNGTIRGTAVVLTRTGDKEARHGKPVVLDNGMVFDWLDEDSMIEDFGHEAVVREGKTIKPENGDLEPFDFDELFPVPDPAVIAKAWEIPLRDGSAASNDAEWEEEDEQPKARAGRGRRSRTRAEPEEEVEADEEDEVEEEEEKPARARSRSRSGGGGTRSRTRRKSASETLDGDEIPF